ncbi:prepilin-type N-terminal cleavage/methylation domain-containing protein [Patescibacteria group bacterium]
MGVKRKPQKGQLRDNRKKTMRGFGLIESLVSIAVISLLIVVVGGYIITQRLQRHSQYQTLARQLMVEEIESLRSASFSDLGNRTNTPFIEVGYNSGTWAIEAPVNPQSDPYVYTVYDASGDSNPSRQIVPVGKVGDAVLESYFRIKPTSPAGWKIGMYYRYHDSQNYNLVTVSSSQIRIVKVVEGVETQLWSKAKTINTNTWYSFTMNSQGNSFSVLINGVNETGSPVEDNEFSQGYFALAGFDGVTAEFDDIFVSNITTNFWSFPLATEQVGSIAVGWQRTTPENIPNGSTSITINDLEPGYSDIKKVDLTVSWTEGANAKSLSNTMYINRLSVLP